MARLICGAAAVTLLAMACLIWVHGRLAGSGPAPERSTVDPLDEGTGPIGASAEDGWVSFAGGRLRYRQDVQRNRVPDFSQVGYHGGDAAIPTVPVRASLNAMPAGDDTARIQAAIDEVARSGQPGAVQLGPGAYRLVSTVNVNSGGVVLRGSGSGSGGTTLVGVGAPHVLVRLAGTGTPAKTGASHAVTDDYVPVGATELTLSDVSDLVPGDRVVVARPITQQWVHAIGMDAIPARPDGTPSTQWKAGTGLQFKRTVVAVSGHTLRLDVPLPQALEKQYTDAVVWRYVFPGRVREVGLESLAADGQAFAADPTWHDKGYFDSQLVVVDAAEESWVRDVVAQHFGAAFTVGAEALRVSVLDTASLDESVPQDITAQPMAYTVAGQQSLVARCRVTGSNLHAWVTESRTAGPNVFTRCTATNTGNRKIDAGPHQRWAAGTLYDAMTMDGSGMLRLEDRQWQGTGQGWAGANDVLWNCSVGTYHLENPPTAHNWAFGCTGNLEPPAAGHRSGEVVSDGAHVAPESLYEQQLADRRAGRPAGLTVEPAVEERASSGPVG